MTTLQLLKELKEMTKEVIILRNTLKKKNDNHYSPEKITFEENDLIYKNIKFLDSVDWSVKRLDNYIASNNRMIKKLS